MRIIYKDIEGDTLPIESSFAFNEDAESVQASFNGELSRNDGGYMLRGEIDFSLDCTCDRCGGEAHVEMAADIFLMIRPAAEMPKGEEYEMTDDDGEEYITDPEFLDLDEILREEIILQLPVKRLCSADCADNEYTSGDDLDAEGGLRALKKLLK